MLTYTEQMTPSTETIEKQLAERIRDMERRYARAHTESTGAAGETPNGVMATGWPAVDAALGGGLVRGALHEWFGLIQPSVAPNSSNVHPPQRTETTGRVPTSKQTKGDATDAPLHFRRGSWSPPVCLLVHLARQALRMDTGPLWAVWVGKRCFPYPGVLACEGNGVGLLERSLFVAPRDAASCLWAIDLVLRSPAVGVVVGDGSTFDMAATRRVQLVAKANATCALLVRPPWEVNELSAAQTRWIVRQEPSGNVRECVESGGILATKISRGLKPAAQVVCDVDRWGEIPFSHPQKTLGEGAPGNPPSTHSHNPRWSVQLLRCKGVQPERAHGVWVLEWNRATRTVGLSAPMADRSRDPQATATNSRGEKRRSHRSA